MSFWTAIALIVLIATLGRIYSARQKTLRRNPVAPDGSEAARLRAEVARLNDRIKVLEDALLKIANANRGYDEATYTNAYDALNQGKVTR